MSLFSRLLSLKRQEFILNKVIIGAPSLTGKDFNEVKKEVFGKLEFPVTKLLTNLSGRPLLTPACILEAGQEKLEVEFNTEDDFTRFFSDIEALSELNQWEKAVVIAAPDAYNDDSVDEANDTNDDSASEALEELKVAYEANPNGLSKEQLVELANALGIQTRSNSTTTWLQEKIDEALTAPSNTEGE